MYKRLYPFKMTIFEEMQAMTEVEKEEVWGEDHYAGRKPPRDRVLMTARKAPNRKVEESG